MVTKHAFFPTKKWHDNGSIEMVLIDGGANGKWKYARNGGIDRKIIYTRTTNDDLLMVINDDLMGFK